MRFVVNENYWGAAPLIDEIFVRFVPDDASQTAAMVAGDGDLGTFIAYSDMPALEEAGVKIVMVFSGYNEGMYFCLDEELCHPALQDVRVRQAIAYALDRFSLNEDLLLGLTVPAVTFWDNTPFADPSLEAYPFDPAQANSLLDAAGWVDSNGDGTRDKDGVELVLRFGTTDRQIRLDTQAVWQQNLADVGIGIELFSWDFDTYFASYPDGPTLNGELDLMEWSDSPNYPDPDDPNWLCSEIPTDENPAGVNSTRYCDEELDALFQQQKFQVDFAERQQTFYQISQMVYEKVYWLGIWQDPDAWALSSRLQNVKLSGVSPFYNIAEWDLAIP
jgi:peptide/nickel transport system substrate-binding protein